MTKELLAAICLALLAPMAAASEPIPCPLRMADVTARSGITFRHTDGGSGRRYIVESVVAGLALFDYDGDGWIDIYFTNGAPLRGTVIDPPPRHALYRNNGDWTFTDVTMAAGVGDLGYGLGVTVGDYDNDGDPDLYLSNFGPNVLYRNNGDGTFSDVTRQASVDRGNKVGAGTCFLDMEGDGDLDLYAANYVDFNYDNHVIRRIGPHQFYSGPNDYQGVPDNLFRNNGDGTFTDVSGSCGNRCGRRTRHGHGLSGLRRRWRHGRVRGQRRERPTSCFRTTAADTSRKSACWPASPTTAWATRIRAWAPTVATTTTTDTWIYS